MYLALVLLPIGSLLFYVCVDQLQADHFHQFLKQLVGNKENEKLERMHLFYRRKDHVNRELLSQRRWPDKWGFLASEYRQVCIGREIVIWSVTVKF